MPFATCRGSRHREKSTEISTIRDAGYGFPIRPSASQHLLGIFPSPVASFLPTKEYPRTVAQPVVVH
ncbi:F-box protein SKIP23-like protein [Anopheles sinensis]|uniref:F-box protein SKIP23-like protein n=1 Tax=Anopheles sinensis TaxID=74873 RepID=A0A084WSN4_ANOSI|nr:F-box protein SKIP23-like protein [Anopheles sinensis]